MSKKGKIPLSIPQPPLQSPFAALELGNLPPGPEPQPESDPGQKPTKRGRVVIRREKAQRGGKLVTIIEDFPTAVTDQELAEFVREARKSCGCGGTCKERHIELQGEQVRVARDFFTRQGFQVVGVT